MPDRFSRMEPVVTTVLDRVDAAAAAMEQAFLSAGEGLGRGLDTFNGLSGSLTDFLGKLQGGSMEAASCSIGALAERLVAISQALPRDAAVLQDLSGGAEGIGKHFEALLEHIRMMTIIASSARIEAAVLNQAAGLDSFTLEIGALTAAVGTAVSGCARNHAAMTERIGRLHVAQAGLDRDFRERLLTLARELSQTFALITERQGQSRAMTEGLQGLSAVIARNAGSALMGLQCGDAARQRLEHIATALRLGSAIARGDSPLGPLPDAERSSLLAALHALQAMQLENLTDNFAAEAGDIDALLRLLRDDTARIVSDSRAVVGGTGQGGGSFLTEFRGRLNDAAALVGTCDRARHGVTTAMEALRADVADLSRTIGDLGVTTRDLIVVGINAGLKAARLGAEGRSLMVIADELKRLASLITEVASQLVISYEALVQGSRSLDRDDKAAVTAGDADMLAIAAALEASDTHMTGFVNSLQIQAQRFDAELDAVQDRFRTTVAAITSLRDGASAMADAAAAAPDDYIVAGPHLGTLLWPHYTMAHEREVHLAVAGGVAETTFVASGTGDTADDVLFSEAV